MRKLSWFVLVVCALVGLGATVTTIKLFTDYPNGSPSVGSDFILLQRGGTYVNESQSQALAAWFDNPTFTGNGSINGTFNVGSTLTVGGAVITGVTFYGDGSGLSNLASQVYIKADAGFGTNITLLGTTIFDEIDANLVYATNWFTFLTNSQYLATDGDGKLISGTGLPATNVLLSAGANISFTTNGSGRIEIASSGTNTVDTSTNNLIVVTNIIVYSNLTVLQNIYVSTNFSTNFYSSISYITNLTAITEIVTNLYVTQGFFTNLYASTNFSTNLYFVSGKGNTLIITNVAVYGVQTNFNIAASSAVITKADQVLTNAVNAVGAFTNSATGPPSFGLIQSNVIAAGISPILNLQVSTNLLLSSVSSPTNGVNSASAVDFTVPEATTNIAGAVSFTSLSNFNQTNYNHAIRWLINRTGSDQTITVGSWETDAARQSATTYICTNNTTLGLLFGCQINYFTNVTAIKTFR